MTTESWADIINQKLAPMEDREMMDNDIARRLWLHAIRHANFLAHIKECIANGKRNQSASTPDTREP